MRRLFALAGSFALLLLSACATGPAFETAAVDRTLTPRQAVEEIEQRRGDQVVWGGTIINISNMEDGTRLEILGYPLDRNQRPRTEQGAQGRFLVLHPDYVEPADFAPGRQVTVSGELREVREGRVGEARYRYPLVLAEEVYLWPRGGERQRPRVSFGVGVGIGLGR